MATKSIIAVFILILPSSLASEVLWDTQQKLQDCRDDYETLTMEYNVSKQAKIEAEQSLVATKDKYFSMVTTILDSDHTTANMTFPMVIKAVKSDFNSKNVEILLLKQQLNESNEQIMKLKSENADLRKDLKQNGQAISDKNAVIVYLQNYLSYMNFTIGNYCFADPLLKDPILFGLALKDNPMTSFIFTLPYTVLLVVFSVCMGFKIRKELRRKKLRKYQLPMTRPAKETTAVYYSLPPTARLPPPAPTRELPAIPGHIHGQGKLAIDIPIQIENTKGQDDSQNLPITDISQDEHAV